MGVRALGFSAGAGLAELAPGDSIAEAGRSSSAALSIFCPCPLVTVGSPCFSTVDCPSDSLPRDELSKLSHCEDSDCVTVAIYSERLKFL